MKAMCDSMRVRAIQCNTPNPHFGSTAFAERMRMYHFRITAAFYGFEE